MTPQEITALVESVSAKAVEAALAKVAQPVKLLEARALRGDAMVEANKVLGPLALPEASKARIIDTVTREGAIPVKDGAVDVENFAKLVLAEAQREAAYVASITGNGQVRGMGTSAGLSIVEADPEAQRKAEKRARKEAAALDMQEAEIFADLTGLPIKEVA